MNAKYTFFFKDGTVIEKRGLTVMDAFKQISNDTAILSEMAVDLSCFQVGEEIVKMKYFPQGRIWLKECSFLCDISLRTH